MSAASSSDRSAAWVRPSAAVEPGAVLGQDMACPRIGDRYAERAEGLRRTINPSGFGEAPKDDQSEEQSASVG
ncbi:hypothetical protein ASD21_04000 [Caulobacter sp. Root1455]|jgi:hypothetical protein|uniref:hypothetical protein n=1 Tax=unclassified Caulobacter TaxID=2648921 RepID=UPI0006F9F084|nr:MULTISPECIES: hypothetical protein [unclassified Caulobacter]KQY28971.1 hypothetical protein ASD38_15145 [Caulobacter sp. Root487D2Y]KQY99128.1 hypothetical protein ASD21_04000 [Caulobacter sp. Root1455]